MARLRIENSIAMAVCLSSFAAAQDKAETCYGSGSVVGAILGTLIVTLGLMAFGFFLYKMYWKNRKGKHLVLITDAENPHDQYAFDNPCFREATPVKHNIQDEKQSSKLEKSKWPGWPPVHTFRKDKKTEKITSMDDSYLNVGRQDPRLKVVSLKSHDFTGLGFNICGNMRDGIFVKDVLNRGPAFESGCINTGDRIDSVCISFRNMVFEDALTILSYASPYDVQVQLENDSYSRPSTLMRSKRESNSVNSSERIIHPKFNRSQSISHLHEIGKSNSKKLAHQIDFLLEKNRINNSLNRSQDLPDSPMKIPVGTDGKFPKSSTPKIASSVTDKRNSKIEKQNESHQTKSGDSQNKLQKLGIKVLPMNINPKMGVHSVTGNKKPSKSPTSIENELNSAKEKPKKPAKPEKPAEMIRSTSPGSEETDGANENTKASIAKGFLSLKSKINQNPLGKKKKEEDDMEEEKENENEKQKGDGDCPVPKLRSSVTCGVKAYEQNQLNVPEEVARAGDVARNNRKSVAETKKAELEAKDSDSEESSDKESTKDESKKPKKGKAPAPPKQSPSSKEMNEIKKESELTKNDIFEPETKIFPLNDEDDTERSLQPSYDSDSDVEPTKNFKDNINTKIELNSTQITVHQNPNGDADEEVEPSRKAASLGDLSKLDSEQPLSIVLERAVSLDLTEGASQSGKKRKAPLPPSEEFPAAFDDYRKEPRLEGYNTYQRRLKKSSDFGTLEDALCDGPKSLEIEVNKHSPLDMAETHSHYIQEFSTWLAECRKPKTTEEVKSNSTSLVNINPTDNAGQQITGDDSFEYQGNNVSFCVNGSNLNDSTVENFPGTNSRTVVVISQPNSLEPSVVDRSDASDDTEKEAPELPTSPVPTTNTVSSPLSSTPTYITEIKVSTSEQEKSEPEIPSPGSLAERIQKFDSFTSVDVKNTLTETSKIPIRTMKSETGQKVLATIQSLAKESLNNSPEPEYAKRMASILSQKNQVNARKNDAVENEIPRPNISGLYFKPTPPKPSKDYSPTRKVPPVVPPRKMETSLTSKSTVTVELPSPQAEPQHNVVTFSSFVGKSQPEDSRISFNIKDHGEMNGSHKATKIILENTDVEDGL